MKVFFVTTDELTVKKLLESAVKTHYPADHYKFSEGQFFVAAVSGTPQDISDQLGIGTTIPTAIVLLTTSYWGRADIPLWEWIADRQAKNA